ncbi:MAG: SRPBCC family protein [Myxococcota bacterium]
MARMRTSILFFACVLGLGIGLEADAQTSKSEKLRAGEIVVTSTDIAGSDLPKFTVEGVVDAPPDKVWPTVYDCDNYSRWYTSLKRSKLVSKSGNTWICEEESKTPFPLPNLEAKVRVKLSTSKGRWKREWKMIEGDYDRNEGQCVLTEFEGDPNKTLVQYTVIADPKVAVPDGLMKRATAKKLPQIVEDLRAEAARR